MAAISTVMLVTVLACVHTTAEMARGSSAHQEMAMLSEFIISYLLALCSVYACLLQNRNICHDHNVAGLHTE